MRFPLLATLALFGSQTGAMAANEARIALVIGNSAYQYTSPLENPKNDAADLAKALSGLGFKVVEGFDLDKPGMDRAIRQFSSGLVNADVGLFFYAGHGMQVSGHNYLIPVDAKMEDSVALDFETVKLDLVQRAMERATKTNLIFLDACRDNPLARNLARSMGTRTAEIGRGLAPLEAGFGTLVSFSTQPGNVALDGSGRNSPFAKALLKQLLGQRQDISSILIDVRNDVMLETRNRQVPWEHSALRARFFFTDESKTTLSDASPVIKSPPENTSAMLPVPKNLASTFTTRGSPDFVGVWLGKFEGNNFCIIPSGEQSWVVAEGKLPDVGRGIGTVTPSGDLMYRIPSRADPNKTILYTGKLSGENGSGGEVCP